MTAAIAQLCDNRSEADRRANANRPLTHSLDYGEEGLAMQATSDELFGDPRLPQRFWEKVRVNSETGCWEWQGALNPDGYGSISVRGTTRRAHRVVLALREPLDPQLVIDHLCRVRHCVNPDHLEQVTNRENVVRGDHPRLVRERNLSRTHCAEGHELVGDNLYVDPKGCRRCRTCERAANARRRARVRARGKQAAATKAQIERDALRRAAEQFANEPRIADRLFHMAAAACPPETFAAAEQDEPKREQS